MNEAPSPSTDRGKHHRQNIIQIYRRQEQEHSTVSIPPFKVSPFPPAAIYIMRVDKMHCCKVRRNLRSFVLTQNNS